MTTPVFGTARRICRGARSPFARGFSGAGLRIVLAATSLAVLHASPIITYQVTDLGSQGGQKMFRYEYSLSGFDLLADQQLDIRFDPLLFGTLSNIKAGTDFDPLLLQPNHPVGAPGDYNILAKKDHPSLTGIFSVDFAFLGPNSPGSQPFLFFDDGPGTRDLPPPGVTVAAPVVTGIPEPGSTSLLLVGFSAVIIGLTARSVKGKQGFKA